MKAMKAAVRCTSVAVKNLISWWFSAGMCLSDRQHLISPCNVAIGSIIQKCMFGLSTKLATKGNLATVTRVLTVRALALCQRESRNCGLQTHHMLTT